MNAPPRWAEWLLEWLLKDRFVDESIGDLYEWYDLQIPDDHPLKSRMLLWKYLLYACRPYKVKSFQKLFLLTMDRSLFSNHIKMGVRSLVRHARFTTINLLGLATAFAAVILIYAYVSFELSYDNFHPKADKIYRVLSHDLRSGQLGRPTSTPLAPAFLNEFGEAIEFARFGNDVVYVTMDDRQFYEGEFYWGDSSLFDIFHLPLLYGNTTQALREPNTVVLAEETAVKYFGEGVNPVGQVLEVKVFDSNTDLRLHVDGVLRSLPANTDLPFELIGSMVTGLDLYQQFEKSWGFNWLHTYAHIPNDRDLSLIESSVPALVEKNLGKRFVPSMGFHFQTLDEVHLHSHDVARSNYGDLRQVLIFVVIGAFLLIIATVNFVNLSASRITKRLKEISVRHISGASKQQLIRQFTTEFLLTAGLGALIACVIVAIVWRPFLDFVGKEIPLSIFMTVEGALLVIGIVLFPTVISALFPAAMMAGLDPTRLLKGQARVEGKKTLRLGLVAVQFAISAFLILCTLVVFQQYRALSQATLGFEAEQMVNIKVEDRDLQKQIELLRSELSRVHGIEAAASSSEMLPSAMNNQWDLHWDEVSKEQPQAINVVGVDEHYFPTIKAALTSGGNFELPYRSDSAQSVILNETAANMVGIVELPQIVTIGGRERKVIGIVKDHHYKSLKAPIQAVAYMVFGPGSRVSPDNLLLRVRTEDISSTMGELNAVWDEIANGAYFDFHFVDDAFARSYQAEVKFMNLFTLLTMLSIVISCIGLLGITMYLTSEKQKEVSIRKVMGSSGWQAMHIILKELTVVIGAGIAIAIPLAIWTLNLWLEQFVFRVYVHWYIVLAAVLLAIFSALITVIGNILQIVRANPIKYLRNE